MIVTRKAHNRVFIINYLSAKLISQGQVQGHFQGQGQILGRGQILGQVISKVKVKFWVKVRFWVKVISKVKVKVMSKVVVKVNVCVWLYVPLASPEDCLFTAQLAPSTGLIR